MSRIRCSKEIWSAVVLSALISSPLWAGSSVDGKMRAGPKELIRTVSSRYVITQMGKEIGSEKITRSDFNDNSIVYESDVTMNPAETVNIAVHSELVLEQESGFPVRYATKKRLKQAENEVDHDIDVDVYANIAVIHSRIGGGENTSKLAMPTGAAFLDTNGSFCYYQLLFWYNKAAGGRQTFNVFDPAMKKTEPVVLHLVTAETVVAAGDSISAMLYEMEREKQNAVKIFVDDDDRIVRFEQNYMIFELVEWTEQSTHAKRPDDGSQ